jgi:hypothetical protein
MVNIPKSSYFGHLFIFDAKPATAIMDSKAKLTFTVT